MRTSTSAVWFSEPVSSWNHWKTMTEPTSSEAEAEGMLICLLLTKPMPLSSAK